MTCIQPSTERLLDAIAVTPDGFRVAYLGEDDLDGQELVMEDLARHAGEFLVLTDAGRALFKSRHPEIKI